MSLTSSHKQSIPLAPYLSEITRRILNIANHLKSHFDPNKRQYNEELYDYLKIHQTFSLKIVFILKHITPRIILSDSGFSQSEIQLLFDILSFYMCLETNYGTLTLLVLHTLQNLVSWKRSSRSGAPRWFDRSFDPLKKSSTVDTSLESSFQLEHSHNIKYFDLLSDDALEVMTDLFVPTRMVSHSSRLLWCRAHAFSLYLKMASTDLLSLSAKERLASVGCGVIRRLVTIMPVQLKTKVVDTLMVFTESVASIQDDLFHLESDGAENSMGQEDEEFHSREHVDALTQASSFQRMCALLVVGLSETQSAQQQLGECSEKVALICMMASDDVSQLMMNCLTKITNGQEFVVEDEDVDRMEDE